jgi:hypothetical protein
MESLGFDESYQHALDALRANREPENVMFWFNNVIEDLAEERHRINMEQKQKRLKREKSHV